MMWVVIAVVIVVAVVLVIAGLYVAGVGPFNRSSSNGNVSSAQTFDQAAATATSSASSVGGGPWKIAGGGTIVLTKSSLQPTNFSSLFGAGAGGCHYTTLSSDSIVTVPGFSGNVSSGQAPFWFFFLVNATGVGLVSTVITGTAQNWVKMTGCGSTLSLITGISTTGVDSDATFKAAMDAGGWAFMRAHPGGNVTAFAIGSVSILGFSSGGSWSIGYSTCPTSGAPSSSVTYYEYSVSVGLTSGAVTGSAHSGTTDCTNFFGIGGTGGGGSGGTNVSTVLALGTVSSSGSSFQYFSNVSVATASGGLTWGDLSFTVTTATGGSVSGPFGVSMFASSGCGIATGGLGYNYYTAPSTNPCSGTTGGAAVVAASDVISIESTNSLLGSGDLIVVTGHGSFSGTTTVSIP